MKIKTRIMTMLLAVLMVAGMLPFTVLAADTDHQPTLGSYWVGYPSTGGTIVLPTDTVVNTATTIPANIRVVVGSGVTLTVNAKLTVYGSLTTTGTGKIVEAINGLISYVQVNTGSNYPIGTAGLCSACGKYSLQYCSVCGYIHCVTCHTHNTNPFLNCPRHGTKLSYCPWCAQHYCSTCIGGEHSYNLTTHTCSVVSSQPVGQYCSKHGVSVVPKVYCQYCKTFYCVTCAGGYHSYNAVTGKCYVPTPLPEHYCAFHAASETYCSNCKSYYCPACSGGYHVYNSVTGKCYVGGFYDPSQNYWGGWYPGTGDGAYFIPGFGYYTDTSVVAPIASVKNGSSVKKGTTLTLSTTSSNSVIYYTLNGSTPTIYSNRYTGPITISDNVTIKAIAVRYGLYKSGVSTFNYNVVPDIQFTDIKSYDGLAEALEKLIEEDVFENGRLFEPSAGFSYSDLLNCFKALGIKTSKISIDDDLIADKDELTFEEFTYITYKVLRANKLISTPSNGSNAIKRLRYDDEITSAAMYKAAYAAFLENGLYYNTNFHPQEAATRVYLAIAFEWILDNK